jgi:hypothetical protein
MGAIPRMAGGCKHEIIVNKTRAMQSVAFNCHLLVEHGKSYMEVM